MAFAYEPKTQGRRGEGGDARSGGSTEEDPTLDVHRDPQTGEQIIAGLTQIHVEVIVDRMKSRFGAEIELHPPRVPYLEAIRKPAKAHGRYKKQTGGRGQFGDCHIEIEPAEAGDGLRVRQRDQGRRDPRRLHPRGREGRRRGDGSTARSPATRSRTCGCGSYDGQHHTVDSSEMAFKIAGSMAFKQAMEEADPVLLEPIMQLTVTRARGRRSAT